MDCPETPDARLELRGAQCALWWRYTPEHQGHRIGAIGEFSAASVEAGARLLRAACVRLATEGCRHAFGPMDGNTWRSYRLVIEGDEEPPFFLEPASPRHYLECFEQAQFTPAATYCSSVQGAPTYGAHFLERLTRRAQEAGIRIRSLDVGRAHRDLCSIHDIALSAFKRSFLFTPIGQPEFLRQYLPLLPRIRPELVLIAERAGEPVAFAFGIPDALEHGARQPARVILKTVAACPGIVNAGLAHLLIAQGANTAAALGYQRTIHALMHESNNAIRWSGRHARVFRRYALFARPTEMGTDPISAEMGSVPISGACR